jgi:hypothetical protein
MVGTFHASEVRLFDRNYLLYPTAFSVEPMQVTQGASLNCLALADLGALYKGEAESEDSGVIAMDLGADRQRTVLVDDDGSNILVNSYSVATRVLASELSSPERLENHLLLTAGALGTQLLKTYSLNRADGTQSAELTVENISDFLFRVLTGVVQVRTMDGTVTFAELRERFG